MGFGDFKDKAAQFGKEHGEQVAQGMDKAADAAKEKFGHEEQIDKVAEKGKEFFGGSAEEEPPPPE